MVRDLIMPLVGHNNGRNVLLSSAVCSSPLVSFLVSDHFISLTLRLCFKGTKVDNSFC